MKIKLAHVFVHYETVQLPDKCPYCGGEVNSSTLYRHYFANATRSGEGNFAAMNRQPNKEDLLVMVSCGAYDCEHCFADAGEFFEEEFSESLRDVRDEINRFLKED